MIVYFADRRLSILGLASSDLSTSVYIESDNLVESIESGTTTFSLDICFDDQSRKLAESMADAGNYVLYKHDDTDKFFTIIDFEEDVDAHKISIYLEDGGLDLLNDVAYPFYAEAEHTIEWYMEAFLINTGFEIKIDELVNSDKKLQLAWDSTSTVTNRLLSIVSAFDAEMDFGFDIDGLSLTHKYVNIYQKRGKDASVKLRLNREITNLTIKKSVANLATALDVTGDRDDSQADLSNIGCIMLGNEYAFGEGSGGNGWVDTFYNQTGCMGYAIRQPGGDFIAKGGENATYPGKNYKECLEAFAGAITGEDNKQTKTISVNGPRGYKLSLELKWSTPSGNDPFSVDYTLKLLAGSYYFTSFAIGWNVKINGNVVNSRARSGAAHQSISKNGSLTLCSGTGVSVAQTKDEIPVSATIDMASNRSDGTAVAPGAMSLNGSFKAVFTGSEEEDDKKLIRYIIVGGGVNDITPFRAPNASVSAINTAIDGFLTTARRYFPYAVVYFIPLFGTIEGNPDDQSKKVKTTIARDNFTELDWLTYSTMDHAETWSNTSGNRGGAKKEDLFYVRGQSVDGGWTHTAIYECTNDSGNLEGKCVGHLVDNKDWLIDSWVSYARTKGVYVCAPSVDWFKRVEDYRPVRDPVPSDDGVSSVNKYYLANNNGSEAPNASSITSTTIPSLTSSKKYLWRKLVVAPTGGGDNQVEISLIANKDDYGTQTRSGSSLFLNNSGYNTAGSLIARVATGWDGDTSTGMYSTANYVTLAGRNYDDGDIYIDGTLLKSREAVSKWTRFVNNDEAYTNSYHLVRTFSYRTTNQDELLSKAIEELKRLREPEVTYDADVLYLPEDVEVGDTVDIVDEKGELYLSTRLLEVERSEISGKYKVTFGDFKRKESGIVEYVQKLADDFQEQAANMNFYTWTAYADDEQGTNISINRKASSRYLGIATFRTSPIVDLTDPSVFQWTVINDEDTITISISSSNGTYFIDQLVNTVLTAFVFVNGDLQNADQVAALGQIRWYKDDVYVGTGSTFTIQLSDLVNEGVYEARLEG